MNKEEFIQKIYSKKYIDKQIAKIKLLGTGNKLNVYDLMIGRLFSSAVLFIIILLIFDYGYIMAPLLTLLYYFLFNKAVLDDKLKKRQIKLEGEAMHFFEVLTLSLETGRNLVEAIEVTTSNVSGILSKEFKETVREVNFGKSLTKH